MKLRDKIKSYSFWVSLTSAIILILKILGTRFGFVVDETMVSDLFTALCSILVLLGIIVPPQNIPNSTIKQAFNNSKTDVQQIEQITQSTSEEKQSEPMKEFPVEEKNETVAETEKITDEENQIVNEPVLETQVNEEPLAEQAEIVSDNIDVSITDNQNLDSISTIKDSAESIETTESNETANENIDLKQMFFELKEKFSGNLDSYIFELQEEIRKTREGM